MTTAIHPTPTMSTADRRAHEAASYVRRAPVPADQIEAAYRERDAQIREQLAAQVAYELAAGGVR